MLRENCRRSCSSFHACNEVSRVISGKMMSILVLRGSGDDRARMWCDIDVGLHAPPSNHIANRFHRLDRLARASS